MTYCWTYFLLNQIGSDFPRTHTNCFHCTCLTFWPNLSDFFRLTCLNIFTKRLISLFFFADLVWLSIKNKEKSGLCLPCSLGEKRWHTSDNISSNKKSTKTLPFPASFPPRQIPRIGKSNEGRVRISKFFFPKWPAQRTQWLRLYFLASLFFFFLFLGVSQIPK